MLPRATYFKTLAELGDARSPEWHATVAGLVVLRLVDDWLALTPDTSSPNEEPFTTIRQLIEQVPHAYRLKGLLNQIVEVIRGVPNPSIKAITPSLLAYAQLLENEGKYSLAMDVLYPLRAQAERYHDSTSAIQTSIRLSMLAVFTGALDLADEQLSIAHFYAQKIGNQASVQQVYSGLARNTVIRGDWDRAEAMVDDMIAHATNIFSASDLKRGYHCKAWISLLRGNHDRAIPLLYHALEFAHSDRDEVDGDLAAALLSAGQIAEARRRLAMIVLTTHKASVRTNAIGNLMFAAILKQDELTFDLYRNGLNLTSMTPWTEIHHRKNSALGYQVFGRPKAAAEEFRKMQSLAKQHNIRVAIN